MSVLLKISQGLVEDSVKPYKLDVQPMNQAFELKHGVSVKTWAMDKVSNSSFQQVRLPLHEV